MRKGFRAVLALSCALLLAGFVGLKVSGCWDYEEFPDHPPVVEGEPTKQDQALLDSMNEFAFLLVNEVDTDDNALVSPISLYQNLAVLLNGAEGNTKTAIEDVLGTSGVPRQDLNDAQNRLINRYREMDGRPVKLANGLFFIWPIVLEQGTIRDYERWYNADIVKLGSAGVGSVRSINRWAEEKTDGMITKVVDKLTKQHIMLVLNALAFDADWSEPFKDEWTKDGVFHTPNGDVQVPTMLRFGGVEGKVDEGYVAARLKYKGDELAMTIVMPDDGTTPGDWLKEFDASRWSDFCGEWYDHEGAIYLPKFSFHDQIDLIPAVRALGGDALFDETNDLRHLSSDLVNISTISRIDQYTSIEVDEEGTKAAAVTVTEATGSIPPEDEIRIDRPFVFFIHDLKTNVILFVGVVNDPTQ